MRWNDERLITFLHSLDTPGPPFLEEVRQGALRESVPIIRQETEALLKVCIRMRKPSSILEIGAGVGFSALLMAECAGSDCSVTTIENYAKRIGQARENIGASPWADRIRLVEGDAAQVLGCLDGPFDLIFMDAAKGQYLHFLPQVLRLLAPEGVLISDNVLQEGTILEPRYALPRRERTIYHRMREYLYEIKHHPQLETCILPLGDGVSVSVRQRETLI